MSEDTQSNVPERPNFESLEAKDRRSFRRYAVLALVAFGLAATAAVFGWQADADTGMNALFGKMFGLAAAAAAAFPAKQCFERIERIEGLKILRERWESLVAAASPDSAELAKVVTLYGKLYERAVMGG